MSLCPRLGRLAAFALAVVVSLAAVPAAHAQGTSGQVPDPISSVELAKLLRNYVHPTKDQGVSIEALHDAYRERFRELRENEIEKFLGRMKELQGGMPSKAQVDEFTRGFERTNKQIADVDDSFFDAVVTLLGEEHRVDVQRARDARARSRALVGMMTGMMGGNAGVDLSELVLDLNLPPATLDPLQPALLAYEQRLTSSTKDLGQAGMRMFRDLFEELEKAGYGNMTQEDMVADPEKMKGLMEAMQAAMAKAGERFQLKTKELRDFNMKSFHAMEEALTGDFKRRLRVNFTRHAYPELAMDPADAEQLFRLALRMKSVAPEAKEQIRAAYAKWQTDDNALVEQGMKAVDEFRAHLSMMDFTGGNGKYQETIAEVATKRQETGGSALQSITSLLGDERAKKIFARRKPKVDDLFAEKDDAEGDEDAAGGGLAVEAHTDDMRDVMPKFSSSIVHDPIGAAAITAIATQLSLDDSRRTILEVMHNDYAKTWETEIGALQKRIEQAQASRWSASDDGESAQSNAAQQSAYFDGRKALMAKATELDNAFFHDAVSALGDDSTAVLQLAKLERVIDRTSGADENATLGMMGMGVTPSAVNFVETLRAADLPAEDRTKVRAVLIEQSEPLIKTHLESYAASVDLERKVEEMSIRSMAAYRGGDGAPDMAEMQKAGMEMMALQRQRGELSSRRSDAARAAWTAALATLTEAQRTALQLAFDEKSYPTIFKDSRSAAPYIEKARALRDLTDDQRPKLQALSDRYRTEHVDLCRKMLPTKRATAAPQGDAMQEYWKEEMELANAREKIRFERDEHSQRAVSQLRRLLTEAQIAQIAGLEEYEKKAQVKTAGPFGQAVE